MKLIVGLGNPGKEYENTRHNIGYMFLDYYLNNPKWQENKTEFYVKENFNSEKVIFLKPKTFMNLSGISVKSIVDYYKINIEDILIIHDDLDLEFNDYKLKRNSSSGGHNGVQSVIDSLGTNSFLRLKIGISKPHNGDTINYVLTSFSKSELDTLNNNFANYQNIINDFLNNSDLEVLMNKYN